MSFVRLGQDGSQVYIFEHVDGLKVCCFCALRTGPTDFRTTELDAMLVHLDEHRAAGYTVPEWLPQRLSDEWNADD